MTPIVMIVPVGTKGRSIRLRVPRDTARWLWRQLGDALGEPKPKPGVSRACAAGAGSPDRPTESKAPAAVAGDRGHHKGE